MRSAARLWSAVRCGSQNSNGRGRRYLAGNLIVGGSAALLVPLPYLWVVVSATVLAGTQGRWEPVLWWQPEQAHAWLHSYAPTTTIGYSILVFDL